MPLAADQQAVELDGGRLKITATVVDSAMLEWWLRGFGDAVTDVQKYPVIKVEQGEATRNKVIHVSR